jgi:hypothetical protein
MTKRRNRNAVAHDVRTKGFGLIAFALLSLSACASLTPKGATVRLTTNPDVVKGCQYVGEVQGTDRMWGGMAGQGVAEDNAETRLRNKAAAMGADTVFLNISSTTTSGSKQKGEAYRCADRTTSRP